MPHWRVKVQETPAGIRVISARTYPANVEIQASELPQSLKDNLLVNEAGYIDRRYFRSFDDLIRSPAIYHWEEGSVFSFVTLEIAQ